jgi:hypothetical protein
VKRWVQFTASTTAIVYCDPETDDASREAMVNLPGGLSGVLKPGDLVDEMCCLTDVRPRHEDTPAGAQLNPAAAWPFPTREIE